jgi:glyoxylase-like metal-dependent hydrolase (beta-lactamase superfamily II)
MDFKANSGKCEHVHAKTVLDFVKQKKLVVEYILETHVHADHLTGSQWLQQEVTASNAALGVNLVPKIAIGLNITKVQKTFAPLFNSDKEMPMDGSQFNILLNDEQRLKIGDLSLRVMSTPGKPLTCARLLMWCSPFAVVLCVQATPLRVAASWSVTPCSLATRCSCPTSALRAVVRRSIIHPLDDMSGAVAKVFVCTAFADFPGGGADQMWTSCQRILALPPTTRMFVGHDYPTEKRQFTWETSVAEQKKSNKMVKDGITREEYIHMRTTRDSGFARSSLFDLLHSPFSCTCVGLWFCTSVWMCLICCTRRCK